MKKFTKMVLKVLPIFVVAIVVLGSVYGIEVKDPGSGNASNTVSDLADNVWGTVVTVVQILAIAAIAIAGIRYMFASANEKADIKTQTVTLIAGAILVFAAVPIAKFVSNAANDIL